MIRFVIIAAPRTGSNLLCTLLDSHPDILCHHEIYNPDGVIVSLPLRNSDFTLGTIAERNADPVGFLPNIWNADLGHRCVGFKMTRGQDTNVMAKLLADPDVRTIVLHRRNRIKTLVSELRAERTGQWEVYDAADLAESRPRVSVSAHQLAMYIAENDDFYAWIQGQDEHAIDVDYEDLFARDTQRQILGFLGVDTDVPLSAASVKQNPTDLRDLIENYDALVMDLTDARLVAELTDRGP